MIKIYHQTTSETRIFKLYFEVGPFSHNIKIRHYINFDYPTLIHMAPIIGGITLEQVLVVAEALRLTKVIVEFLKEKKDPCQFMDIEAVE